MKVILHCSKCFKNYPADLVRIWEWEDGNTYEYHCKCLNCGVQLECVLSDIEEIPTNPIETTSLYIRGIK